MNPMYFFAGSLASNLARNASLDDAINRALHCASLSVTKKGAQASYAHLAELQGNGEDAYCPPPLSATGVANKLAIRATLQL